MFDRFLTIHRRYRQHDATIRSLYVLDGTPTEDDRRSAAAHGVTTGSFGVAIDRWRMPVYVAIAVIASVVVLLNRPVTIPGVVWTVVVALLAVFVVELLRRPADEVAAAATTADPDAGAGLDEVLLPEAEMAASTPVPARRAE